jgi:hypothetical protein
MKHFIAGIDLQSKFKKHIDQFYKYWIIEISKADDEEIYKWSASPRFWISAGFNHPMIGFKSLNCNGKNNFSSTNLAVNDAVKEIEKIEKNYRNELIDLNLKCRIKSFNDNFKNKRGIEMFQTENFKYKMYENTLDKHEDLIKVAVEDITKNVMEEIKLDNHSLIYDFNHFKSINEVDEYFTAQNCLIEILEKLEFELSIIDSKVKIVF